MRRKAIDSRKDAKPAYRAETTPSTGSGQALSSSRIRTRINADEIVGWVLNPRVKERSRPPSLSFLRSLP